MRTNVGMKNLLVDRRGRVVGVETLCAVCRAPVGSGGRKSTPAACARCYKREQRQLEPMPRRLEAELLDVKLEVHVTRQLDAAVHRAANRAGVSVPEFMRRALEQALATPTPATDAIKWKARALVAEQRRGQGKR